MQLVALVRRPDRLDDAADAFAGATGLTLAEARMRLAPEPPALLARLEPAAAEALVAALRAAGVAVLAVPLRCPADEDRLSVQRFGLEPARLTLTSRAGETLEAPWPEVLAVLRGLRAERTEVERTESTKKLSLGRAALTGGLVFTKTSNTRVRSSTDRTEQVILLYLRDGRAATLAEHELQFTSLGAGMQPSSTANMIELARRLREGAKGAFHDDRLLRLGRRPIPFVLGSDARSDTGTAVTVRSDTAGILDVLAEVMRRALVEGLLG
jgi:hypothetical protein